MPRADWKKPLEALDRHVDLIRWWSESIHRHVFVEQFNNTHPIVTPDPLDRYLAQHLDRAQTLYVTEAISDKLWRFAQEHDVDDAAVHPADLFLDDGYLWFEQPLLITDVRGRICTIRVLAWFRDTDRLRLFYFNDKLHPLDEITYTGYQAEGRDPGLDKTEPRTPLFHFEEWEWDKPMFKEHDDAMTTEALAAAVKRHDMASRLADSGAQIHHSGDGGWYFTYNYEDHQRLPLSRRRPDGTDPYHYAIDPATGALSSWFTPGTLERHRQDILALHRFLPVLWSYMGERLPGVVAADRPRLRTIKRASLGIPSEVFVIDLRAQDDDPTYRPPDSPSLVMWSHRWRSRGHWRRYRNKQTGEVVKRVRVRESIKGPEHLPLIEKDRVFHVHR